MVYNETKILLGEGMAFHSVVSRHTHSLQVCCCTSWWPVNHDMYIYVHCVYDDMYIHVHCVYDNVCIHNVFSVAAAQSIAMQCNDCNRCGQQLQPTTTSKQSQLQHRQLSRYHLKQHYWPMCTHEVSALAPGAGVLQTRSAGYGWVSLRPCCDRQRNISCDITVMSSSRPYFLLVYMVCIVRALLHWAIIHNGM